MAVKIEKWCVFCGKPVVGKTKEHVIPQWLMKMSGDPKRKTSVFSFLPHSDAARYRQMAFNSLHFPACDSCNNDFGKLENRAKAVLEKIMAKHPLGQPELVVLLDWLDKVRIGMWLGTMYLDKNHVPVEPKFHISARVGTKDRSVIIVKAKHGQRLSFFGANSLAFRFMPSCFGFLINNIGLVSISSDFLLCRRLGFPFADGIEAHESGLLSYDPVPGQNRIMRPPLHLPVTAFATALHQCVYKDWRNSTRRELWESPYVMANTLDPERGLSTFFLEDERGQVKSYPQADSTSWIPQHTFDTSAQAGQYLAKICLDLQDKLLDSWSVGAPTPEARKVADQAVRFMRGELARMRQIIPTMQ